MRRLLLDAMLGRLATYLRMCGHDAAYALDRGVEADDEVLALAREEGRRLVTRDAELAGRAEGAVLLSEREIEEQLRELRGAGFDLALDRPTRCGRCNGSLTRVGEDGERPAYAPGEGPVWRCADCGQHFWRGSHWRDVEERLRSL